MYRGERGLMCLLSRDMYDMRGIKTCVYALLSVQVNALSKQPTVPASVIEWVTSLMDVAFEEPSVALARNVWRGVARYPDVNGEGTTWFQQDA